MTLFLQVSSFINFNNSVQTDSSAATLLVSQFTIFIDGPMWQPVLSFLVLFSFINQWIHLFLNWPVVIADLFFSYFEASFHAITGLLRGFSFFKLTSSIWFPIWFKLTSWFNLQGLEPTQIDVSQVPTYIKLNTFKYESTDFCDISHTCSSFRTS